MSERSTDVAYRLLLEETVSARLRPGAPIDEAALAERMSVGRGAVREALHRLVAEGLLAFEVKHGFFRRRLTAAEAAQLSEVQADLEAAAVAAVIARGDRRAVKTVRHDWRTVVGACVPADIDTLSRSDERFHLDLAALAGNPARVRMLRSVRERLSAVRRAALADGARRAACLADHEALLAAILAGDTGEAVELARRHALLDVGEAGERAGTDAFRMDAVA